jgi:hypothetical protein
MMPTIIGWSLVVIWLFGAVAIDDLKLSRSKFISPPERLNEKLL